MARLHEYQGKAILAANGFKIPRGRAASNCRRSGSGSEGSSEGGEVVVKIQAWTTGRAGIGGVAFAKKPDDVRASRDANAGDESRTISGRSRAGGRKDRYRPGIFSFVCH